MKLLLSTPLAALSASFATWYWLEQKELHPGVPGIPAVPGTGFSSEGDGSCRSEQLAALQKLLEERERHIEALQAGCQAEPSSSESGAADVGGATSSPDSFQQMWEASVNSGALLTDAAGDAVGAIVDQIWQWPVDSAAQLPRSSALRDALDVARSTLTELATSAANAWGQAVHGMADMLPQQVLEVAGTAQKEVSSILSAAQQRYEATLEAFLERHPEHRASLAGRSPVVVLLLLLALLHLSVWELYGCLRILLSATAFVFGVPFSCLRGLWRYVSGRSRSAVAAQREPAGTAEDAELEGAAASSSATPAIPRPSAGVAAPKERQPASPPQRKNRKS